MALTERQAYDAMFLFLHEYWERGGRQSDEVAGLLGSLNRRVWADGTSADPAMDADWAEAVVRIQEGFDPYTPLTPP
jgi:hypothetical protein